MGLSLIPLIVITMVPIITSSFGCVVRKRSMSDDIINNIDYPDYSPKYDESYPIVPKRATLLFDQLMVALQKVVSNPRESSIGGKGISKSLHRFPPANSEIVPVANPMMDLQRRGQDKMKLNDFRWHCLVNAIACFRKK